MIGVVGFFIYGRQNERLFDSINPIYTQHIIDIERFVYCSLDIVDEKSKKANEMYLGQLFNNQSYTTFGYVTNTGVRMVLCIDATSAALLKDQEIRFIFKKFHNYYVNTVFNPFYEYGSPLSSKWLDEGVRELYGTTND